MDPISAQNALAAMGQANTQAATRQLNSVNEPAGRLANGQALSAKQLEAIDKSAKDFEAMVLGQMLQPMFAGLETDGPFGGGFSEQMYRGLLVDEYGKMIAENGGLGIADQVKRQLLSAQEAAQPGRIGGQ
jgi:Rod binding protein